MSKIIALAYSTYLEAVRSKVLYSVIFFVVVVLLIASFFGSVTIGEQSLVIKDFGLFSISLFSVAYISIAGGSLLSKELNEKTIYAILSRPVKREEFIIGKFLGLFITLSILTFFMALILSLFVFIFEQKIDLTLIGAYFSIFLQNLIICGVVIFFSTIVITPILAGIFTFSVFLAGRSSELIIEFIKGSEFISESAYTFRIFFENIYYLLPHLDKIDVSNQIVNGISINNKYFFWSLSYSLFYTFILLALSCIFFKKQEFK